MSASALTDAQSRQSMRAGVVIVLVCQLGLALSASTESPAQVRWDLYHRTDGILDYFKKTALKLPSRVRYENIPDPESDISLPVVTITDFATGEAGKEVILLVGGEHARELITSEIVLWLGKLLAGNDDELADWAAFQTATASAWKRGWAKGTLKEWGHDLLQKVLFKIVPIENIQGRKAVEGGDMCLRKTTNGVDLNRNWGYAWAEAEDGSEEYGGAKAFSEPETRIVRLLAETSRPQAFVNLHSGEYAVYVPWDSKKSLAPKLPADINDVLERIDSYCQCMHGAAGAVAGYLAFGSSMDYMYEELHVQYPLTIEVYGPDGLGKTAMGGHPRRHSRHALSSTLSTAGQQAVAMKSFQTGVGAQKAGGNSTRRAGAQEGGAMAAAQEQAFRLNPGLQGKGISSELADAVSDGGSMASAGGTLSKCLLDYNPMESEEYEEVVATWLASLLVLADHLAANPAASSASAEAEQDQQPLPPTPPSKQELVATGRLGEEQPSDFSQMANGPPAKKKGTLPWLPSTYTLPVAAIQQDVMGQTSTSTTQAVLLGGVILSVVVAACCLWAKMGKPVPWSSALSRLGSPGRRRGPNRRPMRQQV